MSRKRIALVALAALLLALTARVGLAADDTSAASWTDISSPITQKLTAQGKKLAWPGETAGVAVDPASGDVYMIVTGEGVWKSTDAGKSFEARGWRQDRRAMRDIVRLELRQRRQAAGLLHARWHGGLDG